MKLDTAPRILIVAALCVIGLIGLVVSESVARDGGAEVVLPMAAVAPRDLLTGHYVTIRLQEPLPPGEACPPNNPGWDWIVLKRNGDVYKVVGGAPSLEEAQLVGSIPVKGTFTCTEAITGVGGEVMSPAIVWIDLNIERYHVNQQEAQRIERIVREQRPGEETRAFAIISVARDGAPRLKGLLVDGDRMELSWF